MLANDVTTTNGHETDVSALARACNTVATRIANIIQRNATALSSSFAQHQCCTGWSVDFVVMMRLDDFDIKVFVQRGRDLFRQLCQKVNTQ